MSDKAEQFQVPEHNLDEVAQSLNDIGAAYYSQGELKQALSYYTHALALLERGSNSIAIVQSFNNIGTVYYEQGNLKCALSYYEQALALVESTQEDNFVIIALCLSNIAIIYYSYGVLEEALIYHHEALNLRERVGDMPGVARSFDNIGIIYRQQERLEQAIECFSKALDIYERLSSECQTDMAEVIDELGTCYSQLGESKKSATYHEWAARIREKVKNDAP